MDRVYLDYAATTPVDPEVFKAMKPYFSDKFGNPGSLHYAGQEAIAALDYSRETIARSIGADFREIIFTSSATEANNLALRGIVKQFSKKEKPQIIISSIEHESVLETARDLERQGVEVIYLPVDRKGSVDLKKLRASLNERTVLVSIMYANNETGVIQPISEISRIIRNFRNSKSQTSNPKQSLNKKDQTPKQKLEFGAWNLEFSKGYPLLHTDSSQAFQYLDCNVNNLGVDLMTLSSHKIYGPKGAGALYINSKSQISNSKQIKNLNNKNWNLKIGAWDLPSLSSMVTGGGQEFNLRSGTENIPGVVGFAKAVELATDYRPQTTSSVAELRDRLWRGIKKIYPKAQLNGDSKRRLPNILNVYLPGINAEEILIKLDLSGIAISTGSACKSRAFDSSHVLEAMGFTEPRTKNSLRFSLGRPTTKKDIDIVLKTLKNI